MSLALILSYYLALTLGQSLAERGLTPIAPAIWLPNILLLVLAAVLLRRAATQPALEPPALLHGLVESAKRRVVGLRRHIDNRG